MSPLRQVDPLGTRFAAGLSTTALVIVPSAGSLWPLAAPAPGAAPGAAGRPPYGLPPGPAVPVRPTPSRVPHTVAPARPARPPAARVRAAAGVARAAVGRGRGASGTGAPASVAAFLAAARGVRPGCAPHIIRRLLPAATR